MRTGNGALPQEVQVEEGRVEVTAGVEIAVLTPGEAVTLGGDGRLVRARKDVANSMAWREGKLVFSGQPLRRFSIFSRNIAGAALSSSMRRRRGSTSPASSTSGHGSGAHHSRREPSRFGIAAFRNAGSRPLAIK